MSGVFHSKKEEEQPKFKLDEVKKEHAEQIEKFLENHGFEK